MLKMEIKTYDSGASYKLKRDITTFQFYNLCKELNLKFKEKYKSDFEFRPEPITEGGIIFQHLKEIDIKKVLKLPVELINIIKEYVGPNEKMYKSIRLFHNEDWPWIDKNTLKKWSNKDNQQILFHKDQKISTFLKAFYKAPAWTNEELEIFNDCFLSVGAVAFKVPKIKKHKSFVLVFN